MVHKSWHFSLNDIPIWLWHWTQNGTKQTDKMDINFLRGSGRPSHNRGSFGRDRLSRTLRFRRKCQAALGRMSKCKAEATGLGGYRIGVKVRVTGGTTSERRPHSITAMQRLVEGGETDANTVKTRFVARGMGGPHTAFWKTKNDHHGIHLRCK